MPEKPNIHLGIQSLLDSQETKLSPALKTILRPIARLFDRFLRWTAYNRFADTQDLDLSFQAFLKVSVKEYNLNLVDMDGLIAKIPKEGPVIIVSNHPTGFVETVALPDLIMRVRPDLKVLANEALSTVHWLEPNMIPLNVFNSTGVKRVLQTGKDWLTSGGVMLIYPSGEVADYKKDHGRITDGDWSRLPLMLAEKTGAKLIHINVAAKTSTWFRIIGRICKPIRVLWLMKEFYRQRGKESRCYSSSLSSLSSLPSLPKAKLITYLHALNDCLPVSGPYRQIEGAREEPTKLKPIAKQVDIALVQAELGRLPADAELYSHKTVMVYLAIGKDIPITLEYIQVERERVFREINLGTGEASDGDRHDEKAFHVVVWDMRKQAMIASTRCDIICESRPEIYLSDLYKIQIEKLLEMGDMMEVSRTFVLSDYQRSFSSLLCLWRGLTRLVLRHERVRFVAGVVSVAGDKIPAPLFDCLATYVQMVAERNELSRLFVPRVPYVMKAPVSPEVKHCLSLVSSVEELEHVFKELTKGECSLPVLFKQYESLGTIPLAVSVDEEFSSCVDVLQVWDTHDLRSEKLRLFFGDEGMEELKWRATK